MNYREKIIEICKNLTSTISKLSDKLTFQSRSSVYKSVKASKRDLISKRKVLMQKHNIQYSEL